MRWSPKFLSTAKSLTSAPEGDGVFEYKSKQENFSSGSQGRLDLVPNLPDSKDFAWLDRLPVEHWPVSSKRRQSDWLAFSGGQLSLQHHSNLFLTKSGYDTGKPEGCE